MGGTKQSNDRNICTQVKRLTYLFNFKELREIGNLIFWERNNRILIIIIIFLEFQKKWNQQLNWNKINSDQSNPSQPDKQYK